MTFANDPQLPLSGVSREEDPWVLLEGRVQRLLDTIVQLRQANAQLMKENNILKTQTAKKSSTSDSDLAQKYAKALEDLRATHQRLTELEKILERLENHVDFSLETDGDVAHG